MEKNPKRADGDWASASDVEPSSSEIYRVMRLSFRSFTAFSSISSPIKKLAASNICHASSVISRGPGCEFSNGKQSDNEFNNAVMVNDKDNSEFSVIVVWRSRRSTEEESTQECKYR